MSVEAGQAVTVLLIEDNEDDALLISEELACAGYRPSVRRVQDRNGMVQALAEQRFDVVLSDFNLPAFGAIEALHLLKKTAGDNTPFIIVSGHVGEETAVGLMKIGAHDFVAKDNLGRLASSVAREIHEAQLRDKQRQLGEDLFESRQQLRDLSNFLQRIREDDRARIARELHDDLGQSLTALKMDMSWLKEQIPEELPILTEKADNMLELIDSIVESVRHIASNLRPGLLDDLGLAAALEWLLDEFSKRHGITYDVRMEEDELDLPETLSITVFRIIQEALTNVARHARASRVDVSLQCHSNTVHLEIKDDGRGFDPSRKPQHASYGLLGMRERVAALGGHLGINSHPGKGTALCVRLPLLAAEAAI